MEIEYLIVARYAEYIEGSGLSLIGGMVDHVGVEAFPYQFPALYIAVRISLTREEARLPHVLRLRIIGSDNEQILETDEFRPPPREVSAPFEYGHINLTVGFMGLVILHEGLIRVQLLYDAEQVKETRLWIERKAQPGQAELPLQVIPEGDVN